MRKLLLAAVPAAALAIAGCGSDTKSCVTKPAELAAGQAVQNCTVPAGAVANIAVQLCPQCSDTSPSCVAEFRNGAIEIDPIFRECQEDRGCPIGGSCENDPSRNRTTCSVAIPATASGTIPVFLSATASRVATVTVGSTSSCSFAVAADGASAR